ncbi:MAG: sulfite exporter TauE/SafE family protein, partial [Actinomycetales bacterium]
MGEMGTVALVVVLLAIVLGAFVQSTVGIGLGLVAAPVVTLAAPQLMPGGMLMVVVLLPIVTLARERDEIDWGGLRWAFPARVVGTVVGVWVVASVDDRQLGIAVGAMVLVAVLLTARTVVIPVNRGTLSGAGFVSGVTGTASSIGGPPLALLLQRRSPRQIRTTLAVYFLLGSLLSLVGLAWAGEAEQGPEQEV